MKYNVIIKQKNGTFIGVLHHNIDARSQQLLYNTGRTALIVHNVQGVVLERNKNMVIKLNAFTA
jgi:hypothetical protein